MKSKINTLTPKQYYKGLSNRFDNRVKKLIRDGWKYNKETVSFEKKSIFSSRRFSIGNAEIMHSDKRHFNVITYIV